VIGEPHPVDHDRDQVETGCPWRTAARSGSWRPFGPANAVTSASIIAYMTCMPAPTARANKPSFAASAISPNDTNTSAGTLGAWVASFVFSW
jgi:hypothetical protein